MNTLASISLLQSSLDDGLTLREVVANLPTDPASVITLLLGVAMVVMVIWFGRPKGGGSPRAP